MKNSDRRENGSKEHDDFINHRMGELKGFVRKLAEGVVKFTFIANAGGIATVLAAMKTVPTLNLQTGFIALTVFLVGLLFAMLLLFRLFYRAYEMDVHWKTETNRWYSGEIDWGELNNADDGKSENDTLEVLLALSSVLAFWAGIIIAMLSLLCGVT